jgi:hypothetical protein
MTTFAVQNRLADDSRSGSLRQIWCLGKIALCPLYSVTDGRLEYVACREKPGPVESNWNKFSTPASASGRALLSANG